MRGSLERGGAMRAAFAAALALVLLLALAPRADAAPKRMPAGFYGVDTAITPKPPAFRQMAANGAEVFRIAIHWPIVEPRPPLDLGGRLIHAYNWRSSDAEMRELVAAGLRPHVTLIGSPGWVAKSYATTPMRSAEGRRNWPAFAAAVVDRYGPGGTFWTLNPGLTPRPPDTYQIWNEPNSQIAYAPKADPVEYAGLFRLAAKQIDKRDSRAAVIPAGMFGTPQLKKSMYAWDFLRKFLKAPEIGRYADGIAVHPYARGLRGVEYQVRKMRKAAKAAGFKKLPLYITEIGWSSERPNGNIFFKGTKGQAKATERALSLFTRKQRAWKLRRILWFTWSDLTQQQTWSSGCGFCKETGLVDVDLNPKPALKSWRKFALR